MINSIETGKKKWFKVIELIQKGDKKMEWLKAETIISLKLRLRRWVRGAGSIYIHVRLIRHFKVIYRLKFPFVLIYVYVSLTNSHVQNKGFIPFQSLDQSDLLNPPLCLFYLLFSRRHVKFPSLKKCIWYQKSNELSREKA